MSDGVIEIVGLRRRFGAMTALSDINVVIPRGVVFGLVGRNGAGKTTLIKHVLGLLKAQHGSVRVFGIDPVRDPVEVLKRIGYLSEDRDLPDWLRVGELLRYNQAFFPDWDEHFAHDLLQKFELDVRAKVKSLSRGQRARLGLLLAVAHRPELLILDEPSSGLDPIVRRDILGAIVRAVADEGRTVLFSSHLLEEVERVCDSVAMLCGGHVVLSGSLDDIVSSYHRIVLRFDPPGPKVPSLPGALAWFGEGHEWTAICNGQIETLRRAAVASGAQIVEEEAASLDEVFVARANRLSPESV